VVQPVGTVERNEGALGLGGKPSGAIFAGKHVHEFLVPERNPGTAVGKVGARVN